MIRCATFVAYAWLALTAGANAHPAPFSYLDLRLHPDGVEGSLVVHDFDVAHDFGVQPPERLHDRTFAEQYREPLARLMASRLTIELDGAPGALTWTGFDTLPERQSVRLTFRTGTARPGRVRVAAVLFPYDPTHQTFINAYEDGELRHQAILHGERTSLDYYAGTWQGASAVMAVFMPAGIEHIIIGPDHVLFLIGLLLLGGSGWRLATIVTAFTLGHSITLSLAALDVVTPPVAVVEPVIALSIVFVGVDNLLVQKDRARSEARHAQPPRDIRAWVAGLFGLVHGFGFASVLKEFGLPLTALGWSLFSFNVGVEIGQLAIVFVAAASLNAVRRRHGRAAHYLVAGGSCAVIVAGTYWFIERTFL